MKNAKMPSDFLAENIEFGVELETMVPVTAGIRPGPYHSGLSVLSGIASGEMVTPPTFRGAPWKAERDRSIRADDGYMAAEFISPVLKGVEGLNALVNFVRFLNQIGAKVNDSCGCHITIGIRSLMPGKPVASTDIAKFVRRLARFANNHRWAIYAQTGTDRHLNAYSHPLTPESKATFERMLEVTDGVELVNLCDMTGRGMVNFRKAFAPNRREAVEFRAFAGTLSEAKLMHHLATAFGLCRKVVASKEVPPFFRSEKIVRLANSREAVERLWKVMGWSRRTPTHNCALGLFGSLHSEFRQYRKAALAMAEKFEARFPNAQL
jgi:hypothetical protein